MPSSVIRHRLGQTPSVAYPFQGSYRPNDVLIHAGSECAFGTELGVLSTAAIASNTYPASTRALGFMFCIADYFLVRKVWWGNGTTVGTDNADVAVYTEDGATRLVAAGATLIAGANAVQEVDVTDTLLMPGRYWCVYNQSGVTATPLMWGATAAATRPMGWAQFAGAVPLGSAFTPAAMASSNVPYFGIASRTQVA